MSLFFRVARVEFRVKFRVEAGPSAIVDNRGRARNLLAQRRRNAVKPYSKERRSPGWGREDPSRTMIYSYSKERRSPGWGREDPSRSRGFNSYSKERRSPGWGLKDPSRTWEYRSPR